MVKLWRPLTAALVLVTLLGLAATVLSRVYSGPLLTRLLLGAAIASVGISLATRRLPSWLIAPLSVLGLTAYTAFALQVAARHAELPGGLAEVTLDAARNGVPRLLTAMIPVQAAPDTVLVPLVATWLAGLACAEVTLRTGRVLLGYLPPVLLYGGALYVVGPNADPALWPTTAFIAAAALGLVLPGRRGATPAGPAAGTLGTGGLPTVVRLRLAAGTAAGLVAVVAAGVLVGPYVAGQVAGRPVDPRRYVQPPQVESLDESPLIRISGWALHPDQVLLELRSETSGRTEASATDTDGTADRPEADAGNDPAADTAAERDTAAQAAGQPAAAPVRLRLAVLSDYDGVTWQVGGIYRNAGRVLPPAEPAPGAFLRTVRQEITIAGLTGRLLPAVATPQQVSGSRVAYDAQTGTLIRPEGLTPGLRYEVLSTAERPDPGLLGVADVPAGAEHTRVLQVADGTPQRLRELAEQLATDNGAPYARAVAIEDFLAEHYREVADAPSGHAYPNLEFFLFGGRDMGGQRGTSEQFAAAFAVLGRLAGLPTRVVVGFDSPTGDGPVRAGDAHAWPEVLFDEVGWVAFDPMPRDDRQPRPVEEDFRPKPEKPSPPPEEAQPSISPSSPAPEAPEAVAAAPERATAFWPVIVALVVLLLGVPPAVVLFLRSRLRRRRLTVGSAPQRIAGAWREATNALRLAGHPAPDHHSATEIAEAAAALWPTASATASASGSASGSGSGPSLHELAELVNQAAFAPGTAHDAQAQRAAQLAHEFTSAMRAARPRWRRLLWSLHPGPLYWR